MKCVVFVDKGRVRSPSHTTKKLNKKIFYSKLSKNICHMETKIYSFNELSDKAKLRALTDYQSDAEYSWGYDALTSLKEFMNEIGVNLISYDIDWLSPWRSHVHYEGKPHGKFIKEELTGFCMDYPLTTTWNKTKSIGACIDEFLRECANDYEHQLSEEGYAEYCNGNDLKFYENGTH